MTIYKSTAGQYSQFIKVAKGREDLGSLECFTVGIYHGLKYDTVTIHLTKDELKQIAIDILDYLEETKNG